MKKEHFLELCNLRAFPCFPFQGGKTRGQTYCEQIYNLLTDDINSEPLFVLSRVPDCDGFFVWGSTKVYTSSTTKLCCRGGNYYSCP